MDAVLACLKHPATEGNVSVRRNLLAVMPMLLQRCGGSSLRASLEQLVPNLAERLVDADVGVRDLSRGAILELLAVVKPNATVPALLAKPVLGRSPRTREAVLLLLADLLHQRLPSAGSELAQSCAKKEQLSTLLRLSRDPLLFLGQLAPLLRSFTLAKE